jgi:CBS domain-containing protein
MWAWVRIVPSQLWSVEPEATVFRAIELMAEASIGALVVLKEGRLEEIISERDYARKVILAGRSSHATPVHACKSCSGT